MSKKQDSYYFQNFIDCADYACQAARNVFARSPRARAEGGSASIASSSSRPAFRSMGRGAQAMICPCSKQFKESVLIQPERKGKNTSLEISMMRTTLS